MKKNIPKINHLNLEVEVVVKNPITTKKKEVIKEVEEGIMIDNLVLELIILQEETMLLHGEILLKNK